MSNDNSGFSDVGSIKLQLFQKDSSAIPSDDSTERAPTFIDYPSWSDLNCQFSKSERPPQFEIGFVYSNSTLYIGLHFYRLVEGTKSGKPQKERVTKTWPGEYKLVACLKFLLRSTADLKSLGFENVPTYFPSTVSEPAKTPKGKKDESKASSSEPGLLVEEDGDAAELSNSSNKLVLSQEPVKVTSEDDLLAILKGNKSKFSPARSLIGPPTMSGTNSAERLVKSVSAASNSGIQKDTKRQYIRASYSSSSSTTNTTQSVSSIRSASSNINEPVRRKNSLQTSASKTPSVISEVEKSLGLKAPVVKGLRGSPAQKAWLMMESESLSFDESFSAKKLPKGFSEPFEFETRVVERLSSQPPEMLDEDSDFEVPSRIPNASSEGDVDLDSSPDLTPRRNEARVLKSLGLSPNIVSTRLLGDFSKISDETVKDQVMVDQASETTHYSQSPTPELKKYDASVRNYFQRAFEEQNQVEGVSKLEIEAKLRDLAPAPDNELVRNIDWDIMPLPQELILQGREKAACEGSITPSKTLTELAAQDEIEAAPEQTPGLSTETSSPEKENFSFHNLNVSQDALLSKPVIPETTFSHTNASPLLDSQGQTAPIDQEEELKKDQPKRWGSIQTDDTMDINVPVQDEPKTTAAKVTDSKLIDPQMTVSKPKEADLQSVEPKMAENETPSKPMETEPKLAGSKKTEPNSFESQKVEAKKTATGSKKTVAKKNDTQPVEQPKKAKKADTKATKADPKMPEPMKAAAKAQPNKRATHNAPKRKADSMTLPADSQLTIAPALRETQRQAEAAMARLAAAEKQKVDLEAQLVAAMEIKREKEKIKEHIKIAEELERANAELKVGNPTEKSVSKNHMLTTLIYRPELLLFTAIRWIFKLPSFPFSLTCQHTYHINLQLRRQFRIPTTTHVGQQWQDENFHFGRFCFYGIIWRLVEGEYLRCAQYDGGWGAFLEFIACYYRLRT